MGEGYTQDRLRSAKEGGVEEDEAVQEGRLGGEKGLLCPLQGRQAPKRSWLDLIPGLLLDKCKGEAAFRVLAG